MTSLPQPRDWRWHIVPSTLASFATSWWVPGEDAAEQSDNLQLAIENNLQLMNEKDRLEREYRDALVLNDRLVMEYRDTQALNDRLQAEKSRAAEDLITTLQQNLKEERDSLASLKDNLKDLKEQQQHLVDSNNRETKLLEKQLKVEQGSNAELKQQLEDLERLRELDKAEITKLRNRFNGRKVAAEIDKLEKQVMALTMEKKLREKNRLLALQRHIQKNHHTCNNEICTECDE